MNYLKKKNTTSFNTLPVRLMCAYFSVEKFNEETSQWESFVAMKKGRSNFCCAIFQQQIYAIGGFDGKCCDI